MGIAPTVLSAWGKLRLRVLCLALDLHVAGGHSSLGAEKGTGCNKQELGSDAKVLEPGLWYEVLQLLPAADACEDGTLSGWA